MKLKKQNNNQYFYTNAKSIKINIFYIFILYTCHENSFLLNFIF